MMAVPGAIIGGAGGAAGGAALAGEGDRLGGAGRGAAYGALGGAGLGFLGGTGRIMDRGVNLSDVLRWGSYKGDRLGNLKALKAENLNKLWEKHPNLMIRAADAAPWVALTAPGAAGAVVGAAASRKDKEKESMDNVIYAAFADELQKIAQYQEKEAFLQHIVGAGKALRAGAGAIKNVAQGGGGIVQGAKDVVSGPGRQLIGQEMGAAYRAGKGGMEAIGQGGKNWFGQQRAMAGHLAGQAGQGIQRAGQWLARPAQPAAAAATK